MKITARSFFAATLAVLTLAACASTQNEIGLRRIYAIGLHFSPWDVSGKPEAAARAPVTGGDVIHPDNAKLAQEFDARFLLREGENLAKQHEYEKALARYDEIETRYGQSDDLATRRTVARALFDKGNLLAWRKVETEQELDATLNAALAVHDEVDRRFGKESDELIREQVAKSLSDKSAIYIYKRSPLQSLAASNEVESRYGAENSMIFRESKLIALSNKGAALGLQSRYGEALAQFDELERRYEASPEELQRLYGEKQGASMRDLLDKAKKAREVVEINSTRNK